MTKFPRPRFASEFGFQSYPSFNSMAGVSNPVVSVGRGREGGGEDGGQREGKGREGGERRGREEAGKEEGRGEEGG